MIVKFLKKHVIRENIEITRNDVVTLCIIVTLPINILIAYGQFKIMHDYREYRETNIVEKCRIRGLIVNNDYTKSYTCKSIIHENTTIIINENENDNIKNNPYINRPVKIYKNGDVE